METDEALILIGKLLVDDFATEEDGDKAVEALQSAFPCAEVVDILFHEEHKSPERALERIQEAKPIAL
jgi:hypothetical protein